MLDSPLIEVAVGLSFVFLLVSLLVSSVCEMLAGVFRWRAQYLWAGLETLLQSPAARERLFEHPLIRGLASLPPVARPVTGRLAKLGLKLGLVMGGGPSYIPSRTFALALLDVLRQPHALTGRVESRIAALIDQATHNPTALAASFDALLRDVSGDPCLAPVAPRVDDLRRRVFAAADARVVAALARQVEGVLSALPTSGQGSVTPVVAWLEQAAQARTYVELRATLADAVAAMPTTTPAAKECRATLEQVLARFVPGSPEEIARELKAFLATSTDVQHALAQAGDSLQGLAGSLTPLLESAAGDVERFRQNVERWFDDGMDRVSGAYKRHTLAWQAAIGLAFAIGLNVDALHIARTLWRDQALRRVIVAQAEAAVDPSAPAEGSPAVRFADLRTQIGTLGLPVGWRACGSKAESTEAGLQTPLLWCDGGLGGWDWLGLAPMFLGWLLTAAAVSLGAPFWFDTLKRFVSIRSSGRPPGERASGAAGGEADGPVTRSPLRPA